MNNKTKATILEDVYQEVLKKGDYGYIDGYINGGDGRPYAVFIRIADGHIALCPVYCLKATVARGHD